MSDYLFGDRLSRRRFARRVVSLGAGGLAGASGALRVHPAQADVQKQEHRHDAHIPVDKLPFHLQHEFDQSIVCNCAVARAEEIELAGESQHAIRQRPLTFGWGLVTYFLHFPKAMIGKPINFFTTVGWKGQAEGEVVFSVEINGDIVIDGGRSRKDSWVEVEWNGKLYTPEMRLTLMLDSIRGDNRFDFWWGEPQLRA